MHMHSLFCAKNIVRLYFIITELISKQNAIYRNIIERGRFSRKVPVLEGNFTKKETTEWHDMMKFRIAIDQRVFGQALKSSTVKTFVLSFHHRVLKLYSDSLCSI